MDLVALNRREQLGDKAQIVRTKIIQGPRQINVTP
jgi:hypothetical protein